MTKQPTPDDCLAILDKIVSDSLEGASKEDLQAIIRAHNQFVPTNLAEYILEIRIAKEAARRLREEYNK